MKKIKTYSELIKLDSFDSRFKYLKLDGIVGKETFGFDRYLNQSFYRTNEWRKVRDHVIIRDNACDLGIEDREIPNGLKIIVHHINPITVDDIINKEPWLMDPEFLITTIKLTHDAIHYGDESILMGEPIMRKPNDTCPWRL